MHVLSLTCMYVFTQLWSKCKKHCHMTVLTVRPKTVEERQHREKQEARGAVGGYNITHTRLEKSSIVHFFYKGQTSDLHFTCAKSQAASLIDHVLHSSVSSFSRIICALNALC